jgi:hypothetical protein
MGVKEAKVATTSVNGSLDVGLQAAQAFLSKRKINMSARKPNGGKIKPLMTDKKSAEFFVTLDGNKLALEIRVDKKSIETLGTLDLAAEKDIAKRRAIMQELFSADLVSDGDWKKFQKTFPSPEEIEEWKSEAYSLGWDIKSDRASIKSLESLTYDTNDSIANNLKSGGLAEFVKRKHWEHYLAFVDEIDGGADAKKIYETYVKDGASLPVNLPSSVQATIKKAIDAGSNPDLAPGRKCIVGIINSKFIPEFRKGVLAQWQTELSDKVKKLDELNKKIAGVGK